MPVLECAGSSRAAAARREPGRRAADGDPGHQRRARLGVLDAAGARLSVVGFDDIPAAAAAGLTTVRQDHHAKGRGELLLAQLRGEWPEPPAPLRARGSWCGSAAG